MHPYPVMCQACARDNHKKCWGFMNDSGPGMKLVKVTCCCECEKAEQARRIAEKGMGKE